MKDIAPKNKLGRWISFSVIMMPLVFIIGGLILHLIQTPKLVFEELVKQAIIIVFGILILGAIACLISYFKQKKERRSKLK